MIIKQIQKKVELTILKNTIANLLHPLEIERMAWVGTIARVSTSRPVYLCWDCEDNPRMHCIHDDDMGMCQDHEEVARMQQVCEDVGIHRDVGMSQKYARVVKMIWRCTGIMQMICQCTRDVQMIWE